ncbi:uncharacterized protein LOC127449001 [Myxocyprinus asiaticus]|uniref:uncharacterized protein LOC127449001 n=1 Tax=Myxocyprinus asiaticus TaxID=70543 RepID=UPI002222D860|nr:uncharacterized protein LOC127449001 [Myxocyprinus asiaticus]
MAPVCVACRLLPSLSSFLLLFILFMYSYSSLVYDRQTLLYIQNSVAKISMLNLSGFHFCLPPPSPNIPDYLRWRAFELPRRKRRRRRGKRTGVTVRWKYGLASDLAHRSGSALPTPDLFCRRHVVWHSLEIPHRWIHSLSPGSSARTPRCISPRIRRGGVNNLNLRTISCVTATASEPLPLRIALTNARSLVNKTFILHDFFISQSLDLLFVTETWIKMGDLSLFSELVPPDCKFFYSPRTTGRGGGLASVIKNIPTAIYHSFEVLLFHMELGDPVLFILIDRPPQPNKDFINEFTDFLGGIVTSFDSIILLGDFNIHLCCASNPLSKEFSTLIDTLDFVQWVNGPMHSHGHTWY